MERVTFSEDFILSSSADRQLLLGAAEQIIASRTANKGSTHKVAALSEEMVVLASRLADSKIQLMVSDRRIKIAIIFAMWRETERLQPRTPENPNGEECLIAKAEALEWLFAGTAFDWHIFAVDDGCPDRSHEKANQMAAASYWADRISVLRLADVLPSKTAPLMYLDHVESSIKGGSIILGCQEAIKRGFEYLVLCDCDNSVHLGQIGNLLGPAIAKQAPMVLGSRNLPESFVRRNPGRSVGGRFKILRHMRGLLSRSIPVVDYTAGFKLFHSDYLAQHLPSMRLFNFAFDYDFVLAGIAAGVKPIAVGHCSFDSFALSTWKYFGASTVWFDQLKGFSAALSRHNVSHDTILSGFIEQDIHDARDVQKLIDAPLPPTLASAPEESIGDPGILSGADVREWALPLLKQT
ncbi:glycosyltransferase [Sinorhizobium meliloti]|uniref:glycosyltransferase n=1 Tax=Rhizobium meliloti TaxID=382 RepID=UPI0020748064|nr:glycosyltransferase [Sinorhizobium meliloti]MCM5693032.1 glycosyltransferase [Sinorhizobium meliloti]